MTNDKTNRLETHKPRWRPHVSVAAVIERDRQFLFVEERKQGKLVLNQPAGHWENNETLIEAVKRETLEETTWHFEPRHLLGIYQWKPDVHGDITYLRFAFCGNLLHQDETRALDPDIENTIWLNEKELHDSVNRHRSPQVLRCVNDYLQGVRYPLDCLKILSTSHKTQKSP